MSVPDEFRELAAGICVLVLDVDGVLTDGQLHYGAEGEIIKVFHSRDGFGVKLAQAEGIEVVALSARISSALRRRLDDLGIRYQLMGHENKREALLELLQTLEVHPMVVAYVGDDVIDLPALREVGLPITVADGHPRVRSEARWVTSLPGGRGAVREVVDGLLEARGRLDAACEEMLSRLNTR